MYTCFNLHTLAHSLTHLQMIADRTGFGNLFSIGASLIIIYLHNGNYLTPE